MSNDTVTMKRVHLEIFAPKHTGSKISAQGVLGRIRDGRHSKGLDYMCGEMLVHLQEMAARYYAGDIKVLDEFLQLYCLDEARTDVPHPKESNTKNLSIRNFQKVPIVEFLICDDDEGIIYADDTTSFDDTVKLLEKLRDENPLIMYEMFAEIDV